MTSTSNKKRLLSEDAVDDSIEPPRKKYKICNEWHQILNDLIPPYYLKSKYEEIVKQKHIENELNQQQEIWIKQHDLHSIWNLFKDRTYRLNNKTKSFYINYKKLIYLFNESKLLKTNKLNKNVDLYYIPNLQEFELNDIDIDYEEDEIVQINTMKNDIYSASEQEIKFNEGDIYDILNGMLLYDLQKIYIESDSVDEQFELLFNGDIQYGDILELEDDNESTLFIMGYGDEPFYANKTDLKCIQVWNGGFLGSCIPTIEFGDSPQNYFKHIKNHYVCGIVMDPLRMMNKDNSLYTKYMQQYHDANNNKRKEEIVMLHECGGANFWLRQDRDYKIQRIYGQSDRLHEQDWMIRYDAAINARKNRAYKCCHDAMNYVQIDKHIISLIVEFIL